LLAGAFFFGGSLVHTGQNGGMIDRLDRAPPWHFCLPRTYAPIVMTETRWHSDCSF
jgi:hypothetical protein